MCIIRKPHKIKQLKIGLRLMRKIVYKEETEGKVDEAGLLHSNLEPKNMFPIEYSNVNY